MKILAICNAIDLKLKQGCTPAWWQLLKGLHELGCDVIVVPFLGRSVESLWWKSYENPYALLTSLYLKHVGTFQAKNLTVIKKKEQTYKMETLNKSWRKYVYRAISHKWKDYIVKILEIEKDVDYIVIFNIPLIVFRGLINPIRDKFGVRIVFYDGDAPVSLPKYWSPLRNPFNIYFGANLSEFDGVIVNSKGVIPDLKELGASKMEAIYWGVDPELYSPINVEKGIDVFFYGHGKEFREKWIYNMITYPSKVLLNFKFMTGGKIDMELGNTKSLGYIPISVWRRFCCESKINLNITRKHHAEVFASSTSRIFELASLRCCTVSNPINGLEEWFKAGEEIFVAKDPQEAVELYQWLLSSDDILLKTGSLARQRALKEHTFRHRAQQMIRFLRSLA